MNKIYKYHLNANDDIHELDLPMDSKIVYVDFQGQNFREVYLWILIDDSKPIVKRRFCIKGTGHDIDKGNSLEKIYIGTAKNPGISFVWHVFEIKQEDKKNSSIN